jgi:hypothetical protein
MMKPHHDARAAEPRTLYLAAPVPMRVSSTGEALVISRQDGLPPVRLPVARILRVVCGDLAEWSGAALALCLHHRVSITWLNHQGATLGHLWPRQTQRSSLGELLEVLGTDQPEWIERYGCWLRHQRLWVLKRWGRERAQSGHPVEVAEWAVAKQAYVYRAEIGVHLPWVLQGMAGALVASRLLESGLESHYWCIGADEPLALAEDLTSLIWAEMNLNAGPLAEAIERPAEAAALFERWSGACASLLHEHLAHLHTQALRALAE